MANVGNKEIEIQVRVERSKKLMIFLQKEAKFVGEEHQIDKYFTPIHRNFPKQRPTKEWLRLRDSSGKTSVNYKKWHYDKDGKSHYCDEYETTVGEVTQIDKIFKVLDIKPVAVVDKLRKIFIYKNYEVAIDHVKKLGDFVEIEYKGKTTKKASIITKQMVEFLKDFDCGKIYINYVGYPFQVLFPKEVKEEEV